MKILGINYGGHDTSASLTINGKLIAACEEERYNKEKHTREFPKLAIKDCLKIANLKLKDIDLIAFSSDPYLQIREKYLTLALKDDYRIKVIIDDIDRIKSVYNTENFLRKKTGFKKKIEFLNHHLCHHASTFYPSGFKKSLIVSYDGMGEIHSALFGVGDGNKINIFHDKNKYPNSLGLFYTAITFFLGWRIYCDEGIIMGLAPYGNSKAKVPGSNKSYIDYFREIIKIDKNDPLNYVINLEWISYHYQRNTWFSDKFFKLFGKPRKEGSKLTNHHKNIAAALQDRLEEIVITQLKIMKKKTKTNYLCISGGVGLNCSLNGKIQSSKLFKKIFIQPASGDAGVSYGACLLAEQKNNSKFKKIQTNDFYKGYTESKKNIQNSLKKSRLKYTDFKDEIYKKTAELLQKGKIVAWYQDGAEFGPRALGNRSILAKPFPVNIKDHINKNVKFREYFRPFAPAVLEEKLYEYFDIKQKSPHMLIACKVKKNKANKIPAVVHVDNSCRVQSVSKTSNSKFWKLINEFGKLTNIPVVLNTSFNVKGEPIVNDCDDAIRCFKKYNIDFLVIGTNLVEKLKR
jgi:carbamoyltransferase